MTIGFDGSRAFVEHKTGTENYSYQLLQHLAKIDRKNNYIIYTRGKVRINSKDWPENFQFLEIILPRLWTQTGLAAQTFLDKLDILFVPSHTLPLIRKPGLKTVMVVHDLGAEYLPGMHQLKQRLYLKAITKYQLKSATKLIAVSKATKKDLLKKAGVKEEQIEVIYEGIDEVFSEVKGDILSNTLKKYDIENNKYFLFVGTIQPRKNLSRLIKAYQIFLSQDKNSKNPPKLVLAGAKGWLSDEIYDLPEKLGIKDKVIFLGRVDEVDLPALYSGALAFVFPSLFEGFGLPILEAMSCATPVITSNVSSMPEVAGDAAVLVDPEKTEQIAKSMQFLAQNEKKRQELRGKGFEQIKNFSWEKTAREILGLLNQMV